MFEELTKRLKSVDSVLNEELMKLWDTDDVEWKKFNPSIDYTLQELEKLYCQGVEALKKSGQKAHYVLLEVALEQNRDKYPQWYLRGFEKRCDSHPYLASKFLEELIPILAPPFELPDEWPKGKKEGDPLYEKNIVREYCGIKLSISAIGGRKFVLDHNYINISEHSAAFGEVPDEYRERETNLLNQLVQRPAYQGFQLRFQPFFKHNL